MKSLFAYIWIICGAACIALGLYSAAMELRGTYDHLLTDPLAEPEYDEKTERPKRMLVAVGFGAVGLIPLAIGTVMLHRNRARSRRRR
ncbi:MAG: hypothetical protein CMJ31_08775 [Phycisphaerae bacterium]|nr:hypothetical protein [Phycisphaerae bacterium]